ncbi:MAG TPA: sigma factor-like helix-turn-helix DNA-binding protein, partial [Solirubrobacteraceae bacterium]
MATLENLPDDQRAVLQLVLQRGRGYDEIARLLSIDRAAVRQRALHAFDALGPQTGVADQRRALITDYLLGQLPPGVATDVRERLATSPSERAWARVLAAELAPLASRPLPEIPTEIAPQPAAEPPPTAVAAA